MKDKTKRLIALMGGVVLIFGTSAFALAGTEFQSNGRFEYKSDPNAVEPDVILDSADFNTIYTEVKDGKLAIAEKINSLTGEDTVSTDISTLPTYEQLADALDTVHDKSYSEGVQATTMLLKDLTFDIYIPCSGDNGSVGGLSVSYRNGGTTWAPGNGVTRGAWAYNAPYITLKITSAVVTISDINDYTVDISINKETGEVDGKTDPGSHDNRGTVHLVTRFKDGEVTQSGGASQSYQDMSLSTGTVSWSNVNTYNP